MNKELKFRNLKADEVEVRVGSGGSLLLYKTARVDAYILDEVVGQTNWQKKFYQVKNTMICSLGININYDDPNKEPVWVWKDDAGDDDYTMEKVKAEASDSFKRAGFAWGIGRSLYSAPKMRVPQELLPRTKKETTNPIYFDVSELEYDKNGHISKITITADWEKTIVYQWENGRKVNLSNTQGTTKSQKNTTLEDYGKNIGETFLEESAITPETKKTIQDLISHFTADRWASFKDWLTKNYGTGDIGSLTEKQGQEVIKVFKK